MSRAWAGGSTRSWRKLRAYILDRDGRVCQVLDEQGRICGAPATDCGHIIAKAEGGDDHPSNLRAECEPHNSADGWAIAHRFRGVPRKWTW